MTDNQKKAHSYLVKLKRYRREHYKSLDRIDALRYACIPSAIRYDKDRVQSSPDNRIESLLIESIDQEVKLESRHRQYIQEVKFVERVCESLTRDENLIIKYYYLMDWTFADISTQINKTERHIYRLKSTALEKIALHIVV